MVVSPLLAWATRGRYYLARRQGVDADDGRYLGALRRAAMARTAARVLTSTKAG